MNGFTFPYGRKDVFVVTDRKNKTKALASEILRKMQLPDNPDTQAEILYYLRKADCEKKTLSNGTEWISIKTKTNQYGRYDGHIFTPLDETIIVKLDK